VTNPSSRRQFLGQAASLGIGLWSGGSVSSPVKAAPNDRLRFACIGLGAQGAADALAAARLGEVVALCDIDDQVLQQRGAEEPFKNARRFQDFRRLFEDFAEGLDAFIVSTPNHLHFPAAILGMRLGKSCFCQTPLAHSVTEVRQLAALARERKLATQMGNASSTLSSQKRAAQLISSGILGAIREVHAWTKRPTWPQGSGPRPAAGPVPDHLNWDLFLGPAPARDFAPGAYLPGVWRGWWDFGSGALGDQGCQLLDLPFRTLDLQAPTRIAAAHSGHDRERYPVWSVIRYDFPQRGERGPVQLFWYDGGTRPSRELFLGRPVPASGVLIVGERDSLSIREEPNFEFSLLHEGANTAPEPAVNEPAEGLFEEWIQAIRGGPPASSDFATFGGPLSETVLLGNLAVWVGQAPGQKGTIVEWDSASQSSPNLPELTPLIQRPIREGWRL
jgi:predicted dehydrogenase